MPGVFVAGDASVDLMFAIVAAAEGATAAFAINRELQAEEQEAMLQALRSRRCEQSSQQRSSGAEDHGAHA